MRMRASASKRPCERNAAVVPGKKEVAPAQMNRERRVCRYRNCSVGHADVAVFVSDAAITQYACRRSRSAIIEGVRLGTAEQSATADPGRCSAPIGNVHAQIGNTNAEVRF